MAWSALAVARLQGAFLAGALTQFLSHLASICAYYQLFIALFDVVADTRCLNLQMHETNDSRIASSFGYLRVAAKAASFISTRTAAQRPKSVMRSGTAAA